MGAAEEAPAEEDDIMAEFAAAVAEQQSVESGEAPAEDTAPTEEQTLEEEDEDEGEEDEPEEAGFGALGSGEPEAGESDLMAEFVDSDSVVTEEDSASDP